MEKWLSASKTAPVCYFDRIEDVNRFNLIVSNIFMMAQSLFFLRHFRGTAFGKIIQSVVRCVAVFAHWSIIALFVWIPYALLQHNLLYPNRIVNDWDDSFEFNTKEGKWELNEVDYYSFDKLNMKPVMFRAFFNMFQSLFIHDLDPRNHDPTTCSEVLSDNDKDDLCPDYSGASVFFLATYMTIFVIIITNILIALFGETIATETKGQEMEDQVTLVIESSYDLPFSTMNFLAQLFLIINGIVLTPIAIVRYRIKWRKWPSWSNTKLFISRKLFPCLDQ